MKIKKTDALASFENHKARVIGFARELQTVAADRGDRESAETLETLTRTFEENRFLVVSVGAFKTGKSTLMNALAGRVVCPMRSTPHTDRLTRILATKERETIEVRFKSEKPPEVLDFSEAALVDLVSVKGKPHEDVASVDVAIKPSGVLVQPGIVLVDTPGLESLFEEHDKITREFLPRADLVLIALTAKQPLGARERDFLLAHPEVLKKCLVVITHKDAVPSEELDEVLGFVRQGLKTISTSAGHDLELFPVAGRLGLDGALENKPELLEKSGVPELAARIAEVLTIERGRPLLIAIAEGEKNVALGLGKQVAAARAVHQTKASPGLKDRGQRLLEVFRQRSGVLEQSVVAGIEVECQEIMATVPPTIAKIRLELKGAVRGWIEGYPSEAVCKERLPTDLATYTQTWLDHSESQLRRRFKRITQQATETSTTGFEALQKEAMSVFERDRVFPGLAEIAGGLDALADLSAIAGCMGGPVGGYGLASAAIEPVFEVPPAIKALTVGAGLLSVVAALGGPIGWGAAVVSWLVVGIANMAFSGSWRTRAFNEIEKAIDGQMIPRVEKAIGTEVWRFGRSLQDHSGAHVRRVHSRLAEVVQALVRRVEADQAEVEAQLRTLEQAEKRLASIATDVSAFLEEVKAPVAHQAPSTGESAT